VAIGQVGSGSGSSQTCRVSLAFWKKSGHVGSGQFICCVFFISLIDFDWIESHLISDRVGFELNQVSLTFFKIRSD
jgi:hypothetical protein